MRFEYLVANYSFDVPTVWVCENIEEVNNLARKLYENIILLKENDTENPIVETKESNNSFFIKLKDGNYISFEKAVSRYAKVVI